MSASIASAKWLHAAETRAVIAALEAARPNASRFVGGCVRNTLLNTPVDDIDIATQLLPDDVVKAARAAGLSAVPTGIEHGTITVIANHVPHEVTTLRRDVTTDGRRATVAFTEDWNEDAQRRDFRMNALYAAPDGTIHDPTGGGVDDAKAGRVMFIGDAETRIREDYLRVLRFFRFNAWYGKGALDATGLAACAKLKDGLAQLSAERVWKESKKFLAAPDPRAALAAFEQSGVRAEFWPDATKLDRLNKLIAIEDDLFLDPDPLLRFATTLPDQAAARRAAPRLKMANDERDRVVAALGAEPRVVSYMSMREVHRAVYALGNQTFNDRAMIGFAGEHNDRTAVQWRALLPLAATWIPPTLPLSGDEVMAAGVPPGPMVGKVLREVEAWWVDADFPDDKFALVERLKAVAQALI